MRNKDDRIEGLSLKVAPLLARDIQKAVTDLTKKTFGI
ncbi:UNVERIFIED_ORG: hypothetical protein ABRZ91_000865 [Heyndrickxia coagulans]